MIDPTLTIVVALKDAAANLAELAARFSAAAGGEIQLLFVFAGPPPNDWTCPSGVETINSGRSALIPELWRDGILRARAPRVALTTGHCIPHQDWVASLLAADLRANVGVGGLFELDPRCSAVQKSIYLLRYLAFAPPQHSREVADIAADNAVYRRAEIMANSDLLKDGFWEPSFHRRFAADGLSLCIIPEMKVAYFGRELAADFARQRRAHGCEYGESRARGRPFPQRIIFLLMSPLIPVVILARVTRRACRKSTYLSALPVALPWLLWFVGSWSVGECAGYLNALFRPVRGRPAHDAP